MIIRRILSVRCGNPVSDTNTFPMKMIVQSQQGGQFTTATDEYGNSINFYVPESAGGAGQGFRPMQGLIASLGGCASIDVLLVLHKQKQPVEDLRVEIEGERVPNTEPALWQTVNIVFYIKGAVDPEKANRAVELSMTKYCSVAETLRQAGAALTWEVRLEA